MPSSSPQHSGKSPSVKSDIYYTNDDIRFLHEVVTHAQELFPQLPKRERVPTNALFTAYYALLPKIGVDAAHDSRYARILFKVGGTRGSHSLFEKFETVMSQMGIELQYDQDASNGGDDDSNTDDRHMVDERLDAEALSSENRENPSGLNTLRGRQRRNSEGSAWDIADGIRAARAMRTVPRLSHLIPDSGLKTPKRWSLSSAVEHTIPFLERGSRRDDGDNVELEIKAKEPLHITHHKVSSSQGSMNIRRRSPRQSEYDSKTTSTWDSVDDEAEPASLAQTAPTSKAGDSDASKSNHRPNPSQGSDTLIDIKVSLLNQYHTNNLLRHTWLLWKQGALQLHVNNRNMEALATHRDKQILVRQALESWQVQLEAHRRAAETERFFAHLERRAGRARDIFLVTKGFLHWIQCAYGEAERTSVARRHILRIRYFEAWRGLTSINELKVRRQVVQKFFAIWQERRDGSNRDDFKALITCDGNLIHRLFWTWFISCQERQALTWSVIRIKSRTFRKWTKIVNDIFESETNATMYHRLTIKKRAYLKWASKGRERRDYYFQADKHRRNNLCYKILRKFGLEFSLCSPSHQIQTVVCRRLKRDCLRAWLDRARQELHATDINCLKIKSEAWIAWISKTHFQTIKSHIDNRLLLQGLHVWMLAERTILSQRLLKRRAAQLTLYKLAERSQVWIRMETRALQWSDKFAYQRLATKAIVTWRARLQIQSEQESIASCFASPSTLRKTSTKWLLRTQQTIKLQTWAKDGEYYFLATKTLRKWKDATESSKREKRRVAYVLIRRTKKMSLARSALAKWHRQAENFMKIDHHSAELIYNKHIMFGLDIFDRWMRRVEEVEELESLGHRIQWGKQLTLWTAALSIQQDLQSIATSILGKRKLALSVKMWKRAALQIRATQYVASKLREGHSRKILKRSITQWHQRALNYPSMFDVDSVNRSGRAPSLERNIFGAMERAEALSEFGDDPDVHQRARTLDEANSGVTNPRYLSTPSKRILKARAIEILSSTTPIAPLSTPFERHLRAQYSADLLSSFRRTVGNNLLGKKGHTADKHTFKEADTGREEGS